MEASFSFCGTAKGTFPAGKASSSQNASVITAKSAAVVYQCRVAGDATSIRKRGSDGVAIASQHEGAMVTIVCGVTTRNAWLKVPSAWLSQRMSADQLFRVRCLRGNGDPRN
jgi:hypothetical protein